MYGFFSFTRSINYNTYLLISENISFRRFIKLERKGNFNVVISVKHVDEHTHLDCLVVSRVLVCING